MAEITINITGPLADVKEGDYLWAASEDDGTVSERLVVGVEYTTNSDGEWVIDYFKLADEDADEDDPDDDNWEWFGPRSAFLTEREAIEHKLEEINRDIAEDEQELQARRSVRHKLQRRLTVLTDGELFDNGD